MVASLGKAIGTGYFEKIVRNVGTTAASFGVVPLNRNGCLGSSRKSGAVLQCFQEGIGDAAQWFSVGSDCNGRTIVHFRYVGVGL